MVREVYQDIIALVLQAAQLAKTVGIDNLLQPGLVKEMIIAEHLGHQLITSKRDADACDPRDTTMLYEYLSCKEGGSGQFDRMFKAPPEKRQESLQRILRNRQVFYAVFYADNQTKVKVIYALEPQVLAAAAVEQLDRSQNDISHVGFRESWVQARGQVVYRDSGA